MADVEIKYNNATIASLSDSGTEVLETNGTYLTDDIAVEYTKPTPNLQSKTTSPTTSSRTITADSGYDGLSQVTVNAISPTKSAQTYTPTTTDQTIASGRWLTGAQTIKGDANLVAANIADGVTIFGVTGTHQGGGGGSTVVDLSQNWETENQSLISYFASGTEYSFKAIKIDNTVYFSFLAYWEDPAYPFYEDSTDISLSCASFGDSWGASKEAIGFMSSEEIVYPVSAEMYFDKTVSFPHQLFLTAYVPSGLSGNGLLYVSFFGHADVA